MNYFWGNVFEYFKDRRFASVFFGTLVALVVVLFIGVIVNQVIQAYELQDDVPYLLAGAAFVFVAWITGGIVRARARARNRYKNPPLSRDELIKARSKLKGNKT
jgi:hypothetical protein